MAALAAAQADEISISTLSMTWIGVMQDWKLS
jgi:hypothetical protein